MASEQHQTADILRRLENIARVGTVAEVRPGRPARCRVQSGELLTTWVPWIALRAGGAGDGRRWSCPAVGEQCLLISPGGELVNAIALPGIYSDALPQGSENPAADRTDWSATDFMEHDRDAGTLTITIGASVLVMAADGCTLTTPSLTVDSPQSTFTGKVTVRGLLSYQAGIAGRAGAGAGGRNVIQGGIAMEGGSITHDGINIGAAHTHQGVHGQTGGPQ